MQSARWALGAWSLLLLASCVADAPFPDTVSTPDPDEFEAISSGSAKDTPTAGETWLATFETSQGNFTVEVHPEWAPRGAARFRELVESGFFTDCRFFRVVEGFMVQFGINGDPAVAAKWRDATIPDDPVKQSNVRGMMTFATSGPNSRTSQMFINFGNNSQLDGQGFSPFARVTEGMRVVDKLYNGYGEGAPQGRGPDQGRIQTEGNAYLIKSFPKLDYIKSVTIVSSETAAATEENANSIAEATASEEEAPAATKPAPEPAADAATSADDVPTKPAALEAAPEKPAAAESETPAADAN